MPTNNIVRMDWNERALVAVVSLLILATAAYVGWIGTLLGDAPSLPVAQIQLVVAVGSALAGVAIGLQSQARRFDRRQRARFALMGARMAASFRRLLSRG